MSHRIGGRRMWWSDRTNITWVGLCLVVSVGLGLSQVWGQQTDGSIIIEDFQHGDADGFPEHWDAQRSVTTAKHTYRIRMDGDEAVLESRDSNQRIYTKHMSWDPKTHPILTWRWRVASAPKDAEFIAAVYPSLDVDLMFIPVNTKYIWSLDQPVGMMKQGGMFSATEVVIRSGLGTVGEWVEERVNVYQDFLDIHDHEPAPKAWGISLLGGPGVEVDFGVIAVHPQ